MNYRYESVEDFSLPLTRHKKDRAWPGAVLQTSKDLLLTSERQYQLSFGIGMIDGSGITMDSTGQIITFNENGLYRLELGGRARSVKDSELEWTIRCSSIPADASPFTTTPSYLKSADYFYINSSTMVRFGREFTATIHLNSPTLGEILVPRGLRLSVYRVS